MLKCLDHIEGVIEGLLKMGRFGHFDYAQYSAALDDRNSNTNGFF